MDNMREALELFGTLTCLLGCCCILLPIRFVINKCTKSDISVEDDTTYASKVSQFTDCYDISNPLTSKQGKIRLLKLQIDTMGEDTGDGENAMARQMLM